MKTSKITSQIAAILIKPHINNMHQRILKALETANKEIIKYLLARIDKTGDEVMMVGDRLYTDIAAGVNNGLSSMLVLSGETKREDIARAKIKPQLVFDSVKEIIPFL